nr:DUF2267 domain-containing protein [Streptomyces coffeae]
MAAQLPTEAAEPMRRVTASHRGSPEERAFRRDHGERFDLTGFAGRIAWRTEHTEEEALREASAFFEVLDAAVDPELMEKVYGVLPSDIRALLPEARADLDDRTDVEDRAARADRDGGTGGGSGTSGSADRENQ